MGDRGFLKHVLEASAIRVFFVLQSGCASRFSDDLCNFGACGRQQLVAAQAILQSGETRYFAAAVIEVSSDGANHPYRATSGESRDQSDKFVVRDRFSYHREELFQLINGKDQARLRRRIATLAALASP